MKNKKISLLIIVFLSILFIPAKTNADTRIFLYRIAGSNRYETAVEVSKVSYLKTSNAVIVSGEEFPDGLTGGVLASALNGPVLLVSKNNISNKVLEELKRLEVKNIYIVGGENIISKNIEKSLSAYNIKRISGKNRVETASIVGKNIIEMNSQSINKKYFALANGYNFADSLAAGGYLSNSKIPLLLTGNKTLEKENINFINNYELTNGIIIGGENSVLPKLLPSNINYNIYSGKDRYRTSLNIAKHGFTNAKTVILTSGEEFYDALSASTLSKYTGGPILLTNAKAIDSEIVNFIKNGNIKRVIIVGGKSKLPNSLLEIISKDDIKGPEYINKDENPKG